MRKRKHLSKKSSRRSRSRLKRREFFLRIALVVGILMAVSILFSSYGYKATGYLPKAKAQSSQTTPVDEAAR
jgi:hypothetical protein